MVAFALPSAVSASLASLPTLKYGDIRPEVRTLQQALNSIGQNITKPGEETTRFGEKTLFSIKNLQCEHNIVCRGDASYGIFGPQTKGLLISLQRRTLSPRVLGATTDGLIAHYAFDGNANDVSGNGNNGTPVNGPTYTTGKIGQALNANAGYNGNANTGSFIELPAGSAQAGSGNLTVAAWTYYQGTGFGNAVSTQVSGGGGQPGYSLGYSSATQAYFRVDSGSTFKLASSQTLSPGWHHIVGTFVQGSAVSIYVDGVLAQTQSSGVPSGNIRGPNPPRIGDVAQFSAGDARAWIPFKGLIDDVRVYNRALSLAEIQDIYAATDGGTVTITTPINGQCSVTRDACGAGSFSDIPDTASNYLWSCNGSNGGTNASCSLPIGATASTFTLTVNKTGTGQGTITSSPAGINCGSDCSEVLGQGTSVTLTATPAGDSTFSGWSGGGCSGTGNCTVTMNTNTVVTANFNLSAPIAGAPIISNVYHKRNQSQTAVTISWQTNEASDSQIEYGATTGYGSLSPINNSLITAHTETISVSPDSFSPKTYHYRIKSKDSTGAIGVSPDYTFTLLPTPNTSGPQLCKGSNCVRLQKNMTWAFLGDSITSINMYNTYMEMYFHLRYPELDLHFREEAWSGSIAGSLLSQFMTNSGAIIPNPGTPYFLSEIYPLNPQADIMSVMWAGNGGLLESAYKNQIADLVDNYIIGKSNAVPILLGGIPQNTADGSATFQKRENDLSVDVAQEKGLPYTDLWNTLRPIWYSNFLLAPSNPNRIDLQQGGDAVHLGPSGHISIAHQILKQLGAEAEVSSATIDASAQSLISQSRTSVTNISRSGDVLTFIERPTRSPFIMPTGSEVILKLQPEILNDISRYMFTIRNLTPGTYRVSVNGVPAASVGSNILAAGWNASNMRSGPIKDKVDQVLALIQLERGQRATPPVPYLAKYLDPDCTWNGEAAYRSNASDSYGARGLRGEDLRKRLTSLTHNVTTGACTKHDLTRADQNIWNAAAPATSWNYRFEKIGDDPNFVESGTSVVVPASDTIVPTVSVTAPTSGASVTGTISLTANAADNVAVASVQFKVDGSDVGTLDTVSPYSYSLNSATLTNGSHTVTAVARDAAGNMTTSAAITITTSNTIVLPPTTTTWVPPIGIPRPTFGIEETYRMYDTATYRNSSLTYNASPSGGFYTHYVQNTGGATCSDARVFGTQAAPRCTIPDNLPEGSVVEVHGGPYNYIQGTTNWSGSAAKPIFIRGVGMPRFNARMEVYNDVGAGGQYVIMEGMSFYSFSIGRRYRAVTLRHSDVHGDLSGGGVGVAASDLTYPDIDNIVIYHNEIHDNGNPSPLAPGDRDFHGVTVGWNSRMYNVWIVDNNIHHNEGDGVQVNAKPGAAYNANVHNIYIARNKLHDNKQTGVTLKSNTNVVVSENEIYGHRHSTSATGAGIGFSDDGPDRAWFIFNNIHDNDLGFKFNAGITNAPVYVIGNIVSDIYATDRTATALSGSYAQPGQVIADWHLMPSFIINNTFSGADYGLGVWGPNWTSAHEVKFSNNIVSDLNYGPHIYNQFSQYVTAKNNLFAGSNFRVQWRGPTHSTISAFQTAAPTAQNNALGAPQFIAPGSGDFRLNSSSPAINAGDAAAFEQVASIYQSTFGIDIRKDISGNARIAGSAIDIGAFEYGSTGGGTYIPPVVIPDLPPVVPTDTDSDGVIDGVDRCPNTPPALRSAVNASGCPRPLMATFDIRPDIASYDLTAVSAFELGRTGFGRIRWNQPVSLARNTEQMNIDANLSIIRNKVILSSTALPELNRAAQITLFNIDQANPRILKDGIECTTCSVNSFDSVAKTIVFTVTGFSTYEVVEGVTTPVIVPDTYVPPAIPQVIVTSGGGGGSSGGGGIAVPGTGTVTLCAPGQVFNTTTGQRCTSTSTSVDAGGGASASFGAFTRNLTIGANGDDVRQLQIFLNTNGFPIASAGAGSPGNETTTFGPATKAALARYQASKGITPAAGYFGPATRARVNGGGGSIIPSTVNSSTPSTVSTPGLTLKLGAFGPAVKALRTKLRNLGYLAPYGSSPDVPASAASETSTFGATTETVLKKFQCDKSIICTGSPSTTGWGATGPRTRGALGI
jgi:hypothetical protein